MCTASERAPHSSSASSSSCSQEEFSRSSWSSELSIVGFRHRVEQGEEVPRVFGQLLHAEARPVREPQVEDHADEVVVEGVVARLRAEAMVREHGEGQQHRTIPIGNPGLSNTHSRLSKLLIPWLTSLKQFNTTIKCKHIPSKRLLLPYSVTPNDTKAKKVKLRICVITGCKKHTPGA
jgi:hypothetical protein